MGDVERDASAPAARCIAVSIGGALYGLPLKDVKEVVASRPLTRVFHATPALSGVMSLRGEVLPVIDLARLLGAEPGGEDPRIVVVRDRTDAQRRAGLLVGALGGVRDLDEAELGPSPPLLPEALSSMVIGTLRTPPACLVLSVPALLASPELAALADRER
jgi:purine-binding chemotaxis protein CheW